jgi:predicted transcriptional regulator
MHKKKISNIELEELVRQGYGVSEIAKKLGVTKGAVSKRLKALDVAITKNVAFHHAGEIAQKRINSLSQLLKINRYANQLLDDLMTSDHKNREISQIPEFQGQKMKTEATGEVSANCTSKERVELAFRAMAEIRSQIKLQLDILGSLYNLTAAADFQREVLEAIGRVSIEIREQIIRNLQQARAIRTTIDFI